MHLLTPANIIYLLFLQSTQASTFKPNCTIPPPGTNYVSGPNTRGTTTILWNCLSIILLCTWSIQHLNIPAGRPRPKSTLQSMWWAILDSRRKVKWMIFTILVPEYLVGKALGEWLAAKAGVERMREANADGYIPNEIEWEKTHAYMANMGYFVADFREIVDDKQAPFRNLINGFISESGEYVIQKQHDLYRLRRRCWALNNFQLVHAIRNGVIDVPKVSTQDIEKLDRGDKIVKLLALAQIIYLVVQLTARKLANLPSAQLEIAALAFSASSMITYTFYLGRPQGVNNVMILKTKKIPDVGTFTGIVLRSPVHLWGYGSNLGRIDEELDFVPLPNDGTNRIDDSLHADWIMKVSKIVARDLQLIPLAFGAVFGGTLFGGLHCLAWDFHFPSSAEQLAWKICSILTTCLPVLSLLPLGTWTYLTPRNMRYLPTTRIIAGLMCIILLFTYILARLFLIVEIFRSLFFLPPEAFIETWSGNFPHWG